MKKGLINLGIILTAFIFLNACTVEKRLSRKGLNIQWHTGLKNAKAKTLSEEKALNDATLAIANTENIYKIETANTSDNAESDNITSENNIQENNSTFIVATEECKVSKAKKSNTIRTNVPKKPVVKENSASAESRVEKSKSLGSVGNNKFIGIILCVIGLAPLGVMIVKGKGSTEFKLNLKLWLGSFLSAISGIIILIVTFNFVGFIFVALGSLLAVACLIHGIISISR